MLTIGEFVIPSSNLMSEVYKTNPQQAQKAQWLTRKNELIYLGDISSDKIDNLRIYEFNTSLKIGLLPIWMLVLWPSFATLFDEILVFLSKYKLVALILSGSLGPLTYYAGYPLGLINIDNFTLFFVVMIIFWILLMLFYLNFLLRIKFN